jgi:hypothetical protein
MTKPPSVALLAEEGCHFYAESLTAMTQACLLPSQYEDSELRGQLHIKMFAALNRGVEEWMAVFDEPLLGQSALDRFCHRAHQFVIDGESYRKRTAPGSIVPSKPGRKATA